MKITEVLQIIEKLETFKYSNVYTLQQIEKDKTTLKALKEQLRLHVVGVTLPSEEKMNTKLNKNVLNKRKDSGIDFSINNQTGYISGWLECYKEMTK